MRFSSALSSSALIASLLAPAASAILLPLNFLKSGRPQPASIDAWEHTAPHIIQKGNRIVTTVDCPSCPLALGTTTEGNPVRWVEGVDSRLEMAVTAKDKQIFLNGILLFPQEPHAFANWRPLFWTRQMYAHEEDSKMGPAFEGRQWLDAEVYYQSSDISVISNDASLTNKDLRKMHRITINVFSLLGRPVRAHPLEVVFFEDEDKFQIYRLSTTPHEQHSNSSGESCTTAVCRVRAALAVAAAKFHQTKKVCMHKLGFGQRFRHGQHNKAAETASHRHAEKVQGQGEQAHTAVDNSRVYVTGVRGHHHQHKPHHHNHHNNRKCRGMSSVLRAVLRFTKHIVLPVFIGISVGMAVSGLGMVIGQLVVFLWIRYRYGAQASYQVLHDQEAPVDAEAGDMDVPPRYEDVYVEPTEDVTDEKKQLLS